jgi:hypothetical protein
MVSSIFEFTFIKASIRVRKETHLIWISLFIKLTGKKTAIRQSAGGEPSLGMDLYTFTQVIYPNGILWKSWCSGRCTKDS